MTFYIKQNDTSPALRYRLVDAAGAPVDLTAADVTFTMSAVPHQALINDQPVMVIQPTTGEVVYMWEVGDTANAGRMKGEFKVVLPDGKKLSFPNHGYIDIFIESELA